MTTPKCAPPRRTRTVWPRLDTGLLPLFGRYSYTELFRTTSELDKLPAVYFHYELSPIMVRVSESRKTYSSFLTGLCAIVGGVFTVAGMVDSALHRFARFGEKPGSRL